MRARTLLTETVLGEATWDLMKLMKWNDGLKVGDRVVLRWTNSGAAWKGTAVVTKLNANSLLGKLEHQVGGPDAYPAGRILGVPRPTMSNVVGRWSWNNTVLPVDASVIEK